jgi:hypothetical protein
MKKLLSLLTALMLVVVCLVGCNKEPKHFTGEWKFAEITKVEFSPEIDDYTLDALKQIYNAEDEETILSNAFAKFTQEGTFANFYLKFDKEFTYTYDVIMEREAKWFFYKTGDNEGFISYDGNLDANNGNPAPVVFPDISYNADTNSMYVTINDYSAFMVTLKLTR